MNGTIFGNYSLMELVWVFFWIVVPTLIYSDAANHKIGRISGDKSFINLPAGGWGFAALLIGIVALTLYVFNRNKLIEKAAKNPVIVDKIQQVVVICLLLGISTLLSVWLALAPTK